MALTDPVFTLATFAKFEFPGGEARLCDGGVLVFDSEGYATTDPVWGGLAEVDAVEALVGDIAPGGSLVLAPNLDTALSVVMDPALAGCRVQAWQGEVDPATGVVASAERLADWIIDVARNRIARGARTVALELITLADRLFLTNKGNVLSSRWHKSIWAGERGCDNCTDVEMSVAWGTQSAPSGAVGGAGTTPGGVRGGRTWLDAVLR